MFSAEGTLLLCLVPVLLFTRDDSRPICNSLQLKVDSQYETKPQTQEDVAVIISCLPVGCRQCGGGDWQNGLTPPPPQR